MRNYRATAGVERSDPGTSELDLVSVGPRTVRVDPSAGGRWVLTVAPGRRPVRCASLVEASRLAYQSAASADGCELIIHDAYHRVVVHEYVTR
jgi:hypothetical protein